VRRRAASKDGRADTRQGEQTARGGEAAEGTPPTVTRGERGEDIWSRLLRAKKRGASRATGAKPARSSRQARS
jgi:hypothetical protein